MSPVRKPIARVSFVFGTLSQNDCTDSQAITRLGLVWQHSGKCCWFSTFLNCCQTSQSLQRHMPKTCEDVVMVCTPWVSCLAIWAINSIHRLLQNLLWASNSHSNIQSAILSFQPPSPLPNPWRVRNRLSHPNACVKHIGLCP